MNTNCRIELCGNCGQKNEWPARAKGMKCRHCFEWMRPKADLLAQLAAISKPERVNSHGFKLNIFQGSIGTNERGQDDDRRQIIADLISDPDSPFLPDDDEALRVMSYATLIAHRDRYLSVTSDGGDLEISAMSEHHNVRELLTAKHIADQQVARSKKRSKGARSKPFTKDSPYTPDDEALVTRAHVFEADQQDRMARAAYWQQHGHQVLLGASPNADSEAVDDLIIEDEESIREEARRNR